MSASPSGRRELPGRPRRRLQVGATNLSHGERSPTARTPPPRLGETNLALRVAARAADAAAAGDDGAGVGPPSAQAAALVVRSGSWRRRARTAPAASSPLAPARPLLQPLAAASAARAAAVEDARVEVDASAEDADAPGALAAAEAARAKLRAALLRTYGSLRAAFRALDDDGDGRVAAARLGSAAEAEPEARGGSAAEDALALREFLRLLAREPESAFGPPPPGLAADPSASAALKLRAPLAQSPRARRRLQQLRAQVADALARRRGEELGVHGGKPELLLAYALRSQDGDCDGLLSHAEVARALGRGFLRLDLPAADVADMLRLADPLGAGRVRLREFVHYLAAGAREPPTDLVADARRRALAALSATATAPLSPRADGDRGSKQDAGERERESDSEDAPAPGCMQEQLLRRTAALLSPVESPSPSAPARALSASASAPALGDARASPDRFWRRRLQRTDWSRVGVGGDGTDAASALFAPPAERFATASAAAHSPLARVPGPDGARLVREGLSTAEAEREARDRRRNARAERTAALASAMADARAREERLRDWKARARVRRAAGDKFAYLDAQREAEERVEARETRMRRRHGGAAFLRMWAGSGDSQFNAAD